MNPKEMMEWEAASLAFETPEEETRKFKRRLRRLGAHAWNRESEILEIFCGRGSALEAWEELGFRRLTGLDLSERMLKEYSGPARCFVGDARSLPFPTASFDIVSVNVGLHHLETLEDVEKTLAEIHRVLRPNGRFLMVEPWATPFERLVRLACEIPFLRRLWGKFDHYVTMYELEETTYLHWIERPREIMKLLEAYVTPVYRSIRYAKIWLVCEPKPLSSATRFLKGSPKEDAPVSSPGFSG